jgi:uncharacterized protein
MDNDKLKYVKIEKSKIHNNGVFAKIDIKKGTKIIEYVGEKVSKNEAENRVTQTINNANEQNGAVYIFELDKKFDIDGNVPYNHAKYINHSCNPNCETEIINNGIWIIALHEIKKGDELFYNYGYDIEDFKEHPCKCGSKNCVGYIVDEDHWPKLKQILKKKKTK